MGRGKHPGCLASALNFIVLSQGSCRAEAGPAAPAIAACIEGLRACLRIEGHDVEPPLRLLALAGSKMEHEVATDVIADRHPLKARVFHLQQARAGDAGLDSPPRRHPIVSQWRWESYCKYE